MNKWIASPIALIVSLAGFGAGFYGTIIVSFIIGSQGQGIGVALHGIWMPVVALSVGGILAGVLGGIAATRDPRGTMLTVIIALALGVVGIIIIQLGSPEFETVIVMGVLMAVANALIAVSGWSGYKTQQG